MSISCTVGGGTAVVGVVVTCASASVEAAGGGGPAVVNARRCCAATAISAAGGGMEGCWHGRRCWDCWIHRDDEKEEEEGATTKAAAPRRAPVCSRRITVDAAAPRTWIDIRSRRQPAATTARGVKPISILLRRLRWRLWIEIGLAAAGTAEGTEASRIHVAPF